MGSGMTATAIAEKVMSADSDRQQGLPPVTRAHVRYWRELCQAIARCGSVGMPNDGWPEGFTPSRLTLQAMVGYGLIVRRSRAWHLRRSALERLAELEATAAPIPHLTLLDRPVPDLPTFAELSRFEDIARYLDTLPGRRERLPFAGCTVTPTELKNMRRWKLLRHVTGCYWQLYSGWKARLEEYWRAVVQEQGERVPPPDPERPPHVVAAGIDTWYLNVIDDEGLPSKLRQSLDELQRQAQDDEEEIDLDVLVDGAPLRLFRFGASRQQGGGVSWSYILHNASVVILLRRVPLGGIVGQIRLGSEYLWRCTPAGALTEVQNLFRRWWAPTQREARWQVSQIHWAVDVSNTTLEREQLDRYVSRARKRSEHHGTLESFLQPVAVDEDGMLLGGMLEMSDPWVDDGPSGWTGLSDLLGWNDPIDEVEDRAIVLNHWGKRLSGITWSPGGAIMMVLYDKVLEMRLHGKRHMELIWQANGWQPGEPVTRHEGRLRREALATLETMDGQRGQFDDPWDCLAHLPDLLAYMVGRPPNEEACLEETNIAWIRRIVPQDDDINRSRWPTDPIWQLVQGATFDEVPSTARRLIRQVTRSQNIDKRVKVLYGALVSCTALKHGDTGQLDISTALREVVPLLEEEMQRPGKNLGDLVRERRRHWALPLTQEDKILYLPGRHPVSSIPEKKDDERDLAIEVRQAEERLAETERRMQEAEDALYDAQRVGFRDQGGQRYYSEANEEMLREALSFESQEWAQAGEELEKVRQRVSSCETPEDDQKILHANVRI
jgi:hypothetical protein